MDLRETVGDAQVLVDTNVISRMFDVIPHSSLNEILYSKDPDGLLCLDDETSDRIIMNLAKSRNFFEYCGAHILAEVLEEEREHLKQLNNHYTFFSHIARDKYGTSEQFGREHVLSLHRLQAVSNALYGMVNYLSGRVQKIDWEIQRNAMLLDAANLFSRDIDRINAQERSYLKSPNMIGLRLSTDQKLAAAAFVQAYDSNSLLITADNGLIELLFRMSNQFNPFRRNSIRTKAPINSVAAFNPDTQDTFKVLLAA